MVWTLVALGSAIGWAASGPSPAPTLDEALALGAPDGFLLDAGCQCWRATWSRGRDVELALDIPRDAPEALVQRMRDDGQQDVVLRLRDDHELLLRRAPCAVSQVFAQALAIALNVDREGDGANEQCVDVAASMAPFEARTTRQILDQQIVLAGVTVTGKDGEPELTVQRGLAPSRALLAHCFVVAGESGEVHVRAVAGAGSLDKVRSDRKGELPGVGQCIADRLDAAALTESPSEATKVRIAVSVAGP